jgi:hypothetical protein
MAAEQTRMAEPVHTADDPARVAPRTGAGARSRQAPPRREPPARGARRMSVVRAPARPGSPGQDPAVWRGVADFVHAKGGAMRPSYALLCVMHWLEHEHGCADVGVGDVKAILPRLGDVVDGRLRSPTDTLRRARDQGLVDALGAGRYRLTPLGTAVVDALPDAGQVGAMRGLTQARCRRRQPGLLDGTG